MNGGNYSCHLSSNGDYLNHTTILVQLDPDNRTVILEERSPEEGEIRDMEGECKASRIEKKKNKEGLQSQDKQRNKELFIGPDNNWAAFLLHI